MKIYKIGEQFSKKDNSYKKYKMVLFNFYFK